MRISISNPDFICTWHEFTSKKKIGVCENGTILYPQSVISFCEILAFFIDYIILCKCLKKVNKIIRLFTIRHCRLF